MVCRMITVIQLYSVPNNNIIIGVRLQAVACKQINECDGSTVMYLK